MQHRPGRLLLDAISFLDRAPRSVEIREEPVYGQGSRLLVPEGAAETPRLIWFHGGAFCVGSPRSHTALVARVARALGVSALLPAYRRTPEHPYPAALEDALDVARAAAEGGRVILGGDSAGGGLALSAAIALRDAAEPAPAGLLLMSPWVDLTCSGESITANDGADANLRARDVVRHAQVYAGDVGRGDPHVSPLNADLSNLPPSLIQCGADELFLSENTELAARLDAAETPVELQVYDGMWHDFQAHAGMLSEADIALERMGEWAGPLLA